MASEVAEDVVSTLSNISDLLAEKLQVGDPSVILRRGKMSLDIRKQRASEFVSESVSSHIGSTEINGELDVPASTCLLSQV